MARQLEKKEKIESVLDPISEQSIRRREKGGYSRSVKNLIRTAVRGTLPEREALAQSRTAIVLIPNNIIFKLAGDPYNTVRDAIKVNSTALNRLLSDETLRGPFRRIIRYDQKLQGSSPESRKAYKDAMELIRRSR